MPSPNRGTAVAAATAPESIALRQEVADNVSRLLAASVIANPAFPSRDLLPNLDPPPFSTQGHNLLLNYEWFVRRIWQVVIDIQTAIREHQRKLTKAKLIGFAVAVCSVLGLSAIDIDLIALYLFLGFVLFFVTVAIAKSNLVPLPKQLAAIRAAATRNLLLRETEPSLSSEIEAFKISPAILGDGALNALRVPVLTIISNGHPFPGYGRLQENSTIVCPPKDAQPLKVGLQEIRRQVSKKIEAFVDGTGVKHVTSGEVVVLDGNSIPMDSDVLITGEQGDRFPPLYCETAELNRFEPDMKSWSRIYYAVQVLFPRYNTLATFFTRPFHAGNAVGYQVAVATLGPPSEEGGDLLERVGRHELSEESMNYGTLADTDNPRLARLRDLRKIARTGRKFQEDVLDVTKIENIKIGVSSEESRQCKEEIQKLIGELMFWPKHSGWIYNWRESKSLTFTSDFFGKPEGLAAVRTLYLQISRAILDGLDALGCDTSDYRDEKGGYTINADKIDKLVVGENVFMEPTKEQASTQPTQQQSTQPAQQL